jgi:phosphonate transport system substrate-binding protein
MASAHKFAAIVALYFFLLLCGVAAAAPLAGARHKAPEGKPSHTFAVIPFYSPDKIWTLYSPLIEYLKKTTGDPWKLELYNNHDEVIAGICSGRISAALLGPVPLGRALQKCATKPLLVAIGKEGKLFYRSVMLTNDDSVQTPAGLVGKKVGFFKGSTAAHIMPAKMLKDAGLDMTAIKPVFLESQDRIMSALLAGEIDAAGVKDTLARKFEKIGLQVLATSPPLPNFAICITPTLPPKTRQNLLSALLRLKPATSESDAKTMSKWDDEIKHGFMTPNKEFIPSVRKLYRVYREIQHEN